MLILASASPRRRQLLAQAGLVFTVEPANIDETPLPHEAAAAYVERLAIEKAQAICALHRHDPDPVTVLAADTTVVLLNPNQPDLDVILGKPTGPDDAARMLTLLSGRTHAVMTGIAIASTTSLLSSVEITQVTMTPISPAEIAAYIATGEPLDKAGAYAIQGYAARWIPRIDGDYSNVVGLPLARTIALLARQDKAELAHRPLSAT